MPFSKTESLFLNTKESLFMVLSFLIPCSATFYLGWQVSSSFPLWTFFWVPFFYAIILYVEYGVNFFTRKSLHYEYYFLLKRFYILKLTFFVASIYIVLNQYQQETGILWHKYAMTLFILSSMMGISSLFKRASSYLIRQSIKKRYEETYLSSLDLTHERLASSGYKFNLHLLGNYAFFAPIDKASDFYIMVRGDTKNYMDRTEHSSWRRLCNIILFKPLETFDVTSFYDDRDFVLRSTKSDDMFIELDMSYMIFGLSSRREFLKWLLEDTNHFTLLEMYYA